METVIATLTNMYSILLHDNYIPCTYTIVIYLQSLFITWMVYLDSTYQLPVGLLVQLVGRCTSIAEVMGSNPARAWIFLGLVSTTSSVVFIAAFLHCSAHIWFSYIYNHYSSLGWFIWSQLNDQLPVGLLAQFLERCTRYDRDHRFKSPTA